MTNGARWWPLGRSWMLVSLLACGVDPLLAPSPDASISTPAPKPTTTTATASAEPRVDSPGLDVSEPAEAPARPLAAAPPVEPQHPGGLPTFTRGRAIRLASLEITERVVGKAKIPSVEIADASSRARLDALVEGAAIGRCKVLLATESLVSLRCSSGDGMTGAMEHDIKHFRVGAAGDVEAIDVWSLFHPGLAEHDVIRLLLHDPGAGSRRAVLTRAGLELSSPWEGADVTDRVPWRSLAPYVRADSPLGATLTAEGLTLAAPGTAMPKLPVPSPAIWDDGPSTLARTWLTLPSTLRAQARLVTPGGKDPAGLIFAPGVTAADLEGRAKKIEEGYFVEPMTRFVLARATEPIEVRGEPGPRTAVVMTLPPGTIFPAASGLVDRTESDLGPRNWAFVGGIPAGGWVTGHSLEPSTDDCMLVPGTYEEASLAAHGITETASGGNTERVVWLAYAWDRPRRAELHVHPLEGCALRPRARTLAAGTRLLALHFTSTTATGGDSLIVALVGNDEYADRRSVLVFGPDGDEPIFRREVDGGAIEVGATRGPDGASAHAPVVLGSGKARTWLMWNGTALEERVAP